MSEAFTLVPLGDAFAYRKDARAPVPRRPPRRGGSRGVGPHGRRPAAAGQARGGGCADRAACQRPGRGSGAGPGSSVADPAVSRVASPVADPVADLAAARSALAEGRYADAVGLAARAARAAAGGPLEAAAWAVQGQALSTLGRDSEALVALRKAVYLDPDAGDAHFLLAGALARLGDARAASRAYRAAAATLLRCLPTSSNDCSTVGPSVTWSSSAAGWPTRRGISGDREEWRERVGDLPDGRARSRRAARRDPRGRPRHGVELLAGTRPPVSGVLVLRGSPAAGGRPAHARRRGRRRPRARATAATRWGVAVDRVVAVLPVGRVGARRGAAAQRAAGLRPRSPAGSDGAPVLLVTLRALAGLVPA
jgi:hypothetical protein